MAQRPRIVVKPSPSVDLGQRTHLACGLGAVQHVRGLAARTGLSQREIVTTVLAKTDLTAFLRLWTGEALNRPTDVYRVLGDGTAVKTATVGGRPTGLKERRGAGLADGVGKNTMITIEVTLVNESESMMFEAIASEDGRELKRIRKHGDAGVAERAMLEWLCSELPTWPR